MVTPAPRTAHIVSSNLLFAALITYAAAYAGWLLLGRPSDSTRRLVGDLALLPTFALGAWLALRAAAVPGAARVWAWLGAGLISWGAGNFIYLIDDQVLLRDAFPSLADVGYLLTIPLFGAGLLTLRRERAGRLQTLSLITDVVLVSLILGALIWITSASGIMQSYPGQPLRRNVALAYPLGDLLLCALVLSLGLRRPTELRRRELALLAAGMLSYLGTDLAYAYQQGIGSYQVGSLTDGGWALAAVFIGWAAYRHRGHRVQPGRWQGERWTPLLPHYAVLGIFAAYAYYYLRAMLGPDQGPLEPVQQTLMIGIVGAFMLRQFLVLTDNQRLEVRLTHRAEHDPLTGARNRSGLDELLQRLIDEAAANRQLVAVLFLDLDRMKQINDTFGHPVGDDVLREVARRLKRELRPGDELARYGGDEFVVIMPGLEGVSAAARMAQALVDAHASPFQIGPETLTLSASVGVALCPADHNLAAGALAYADSAMYQAKQAGKNTWRFYSPALGRLHAPQTQLEGLLRGALERGEFELHFQPLRLLGSGELESFEALLRWTSPVIGPVAPAEFIPVAEAREMMGGIGRWVLRRALESARRWQTELPGVGVAVNVSAPSFSAPDFVADVRSALGEVNVGRGAASLPAGLLTLEITESAVLGSLTQAREKLLELRALGVRIALDDFGTGYSSLGQLRALPVDILKIDRVFVQDMLPAESAPQAGAAPASDSAAPASDGAAFVQAIVTLGHSLGLSVVAEGIEHAHVAAELRSLGCDVGQGYYFARPLPYEAAIAAAGRGAVRPASDTPRLQPESGNTS